MQCPHCHGVTFKNARFCLQCDAAVSAREVRRTFVPSYGVGDRPFSPIFITGWSAISEVGYFAFSVLTFFADRQFFVSVFHLSEPFTFLQRAILCWGVGSVRLTGGGQKQDARSI